MQIDHLKDPTKFLEYQKAMQEGYEVVKRFEEYLHCSRDDAVKVYSLLQDLKNVKTARKAYNVLHDFPDDMQKKIHQLMVPIMLKSVNYNKTIGE